eukprot:gene35863-43500_t
MSNPRFSRPLWHLVDARDQIVGHVAGQIARVLKGKHKPSFTPHYDCGDYVVVINAKHVKFTGKKVEQKMYRWHTGYVGGLKERSVKEQLQHKPEEVLRKAVKGMLHRNNLRERMLFKLRIFPEAEHLHTDKLPPGTPSILS